MIKYIISSLLMVFFFVCVPFDGKAQLNTNTPIYKEELFKVEQKLREGNFPAAVEILDNVLNKYPKEAELYYAKALLFGQVGNLDIAIANAMEAYNLTPNIQYLNYTIDLYRSKKDWNKVTELLIQGRNAFPVNSIFSRDLISTYGFTDKLDQAVEVYEEEKSSGNHTDTLDVTLAEIYFHHKKFEDGIVLLTPWVDKSDLGVLYSRLAMGYLEQNKIKNALHTLDIGLKRTNEPFLYLDLYDTYRLEGKSKLAFEALQKAFASTDVDYIHKYRIMLELLKPEEKVFSAIQIQQLANTLTLTHPRIAESHMMKGEVFWKQGNLDEARSLFLTAVGIAPNQIDAWRMLINIDMVMKKVDDAIKHSNEALSLNPNNPMLLYFSGLAYMSKDDNDTARRLLENALDNSTNENAYLQSVIYGALGDLYHKLNMEPASDVAYEEAVKLDSTNVMAMNNLAYYLSVRKKDLDKAASYSKRSNELEPNTATFQDTYAWVLFQQGNYNDALKWIEKAIKNSDTLGVVLIEHYGDILAQLGRTKDAIKQWNKALSMSEISSKDKVKIEEKVKLKKYVE